MAISSSSSLNRLRSPAGLHGAMEAPRFDFDRYNLLIPGTETAPETLYYQGDPLPATLTLTVADSIYPLGGDDIPCKFITAQLDWTTNGGNQTLQFKRIITQPR